MTLALARWRAGSRCSACVRSSGCVHGLEARGGRGRPLHRPALGRRSRPRPSRLSTWPGSARTGPRLMRPAARKLARGSSAARSARSSRTRPPHPCRARPSRDEAAMRTSVRPRGSCAAPSRRALAAGQRLLEPAPFAASRPQGRVQRSTVSHQLSDGRIPLPAAVQRPVDARTRRPRPRRRSPPWCSQDRREQRLAPLPLPRAAGRPRRRSPLMAREAEEADTVGGQPRALLGTQGQEADRPGAQLALAEVPAFIERDTVPALDASPVLRRGHGREAGRDENCPPGLLRERLAGGPGGDRPAQAW